MFPKSCIKESAATNLHIQFIMKLGVVTTVTLLAILSGPEVFGNIIQIIDITSSNLHSKAQIGIHLIGRKQGVV